jgi:hypothetical protein
MYKRVATVLILGAVLLFPQGVLAQAIDSFSMDSEPAYPKAGQAITITLTSFSADLDRSLIVWKDNGVVVAKETGVTQKAFIAPANGTTKTISVEVTTRAGIVLKKDYVISPQAIDILWEATDSYVPPLYRGKALPGEQSAVRVVAIPNFTSKGTLLDRTQTVYTWSVGGRRSENNSGYNKSSFAFVFSPLRRGETVKVNVSTLDNQLQVEETLNISPRQPEILFYETSPLLGILLERAFEGGLQLVTKEISLFAAPYSFSGAKNISSNLGFSWTVAGKPVSPGSNQAILTLERPDNSGSAEVGVTIKHIEKTLQSLRTRLQIVYDN